MKLTRLIQTLADWQQDKKCVQFSCCLMLKLAVILHYISHTLRKGFGRRVRTKLLYADISQPEEKGIINVLCNLNHAAAAAVGNLC